MKTILMIGAGAAAALYYLGSNGNYTSDVLGAIQRGWSSVVGGTHTPCNGCVDAAKATAPATSTPITLGGM